MQVSRNCTVYLQHKKNYETQSVTLDVDYRSYSFQSLQMDCVGPLSPCDYLGVEYTHILVIVDLFTE